MSDAAKGDLHGGAQGFVRTTAIHVEEDYVGRKFFRRRLEWDPDDSSLTEIADEQMTSDAATARPVLGVGNFVCLTTEDVRWLHAALGELVAHWDEHGA
jgi:hypothetical protein